MRRPNVLICCTDQQRWDAVGVNGNVDVQTPVLDRLAGEGVNFDHCFVQSPVCMPSRVSMLSGQYPSALRITHMGVPVPPETVTLPHILGDYGYRCANIGKLHFLPHANRDHRERHPRYGFDHLEISDEPGCYDDAYRAWVARKAPAELDRISVGLPPRAATWRQALGLAETIEHPVERFPKEPVPFRAASGLTHTAFVAEQTAEFIRATRDRPWLAVAGFYSPHSPWVVPQEFLDRYDPATLALPRFPDGWDRRRQEAGFTDEQLRAARHGYYAMVSEVDFHVGRLLDLLDELHLAEDTLVVHISDHGEWLGEHLRYGKGYPAEDAVSRVPLIARWPAGLGTPGRQVSALVEAVDLVPTVLDACGVQRPPHLQGASLLPLARGEVAGVRRSALTEGRDWKTLRTDRYRYRMEAGGAEALFDLAVDPHEYDDLAADPAHAATLADLRRQLLRHLLRAERPLPRTWTY